MKRSYLYLVGLLFIVPLFIAQAGEGDKTIIHATMGSSPRGKDNQQLMVQTAVVPPRSEDEKKPTPPVIHAGDWMAAWQAARETCPEATGMKIYYNDRSGPSLNAVKVFECVDLKARGELLVITVKQPGQSEESVEIVRAGDVVRIEISKPGPATP